MYLSPAAPLWDLLDDWYVMKDKLAHGRITQEEYDNWRYNFSLKDLFFDPRFCSFPRTDGT
jgi:hypothetical protein